ncbi:MAG: HDOD domain-containing protein [Chitinispirillaceae bacterium]|nr:HDOD domain-containing protein [Chitinispirillaceae bacterium]
MEIFFRNQIIQNIEHIGTSPELSLKVLEAVNRSDVEMNEVVKIILEEPTISAQLLRVANSPFYYRGERISSISGAVVHLGLETVRRILFAIEMIGIFKANSVMTFFNEVNFWKHSVAGALLAAEIIDSSKSDDKEMVYLCGLLRNIGVLAIRQFLPREFHQIHELIGKKSMSFSAASKETIGIDHREITYLLSMRWNLPDRLLTAMSELENKEPGKEPFLDIAWAVNRADAVLAAKGVNEWDPFYRPVCGVDDERVMEKAEQVLDQVEEMQQQLW